MSRAIMNIITRDISKAKVKEIYRDYPAVTKNGTFDQFHASVVDPIFAEVPEAAMVLDVGCNDGAMMTLLKNAKRCDVTGVDISETALAEAKKQGLNAIFADAEELPFPDKSFDVAILREVLVHIHEPLKALKEIRRVLKPSGFLLGSAPHANIERVAWDDKRLHHRYYTEETIREHLSASFDTVHLKVLNGAQFNSGFMNSMLAEKPCEILFKCGRKKTLDWDEALLKDTKTLRVWMGPTQPSADAYYRMIGYAVKMRQMKGIEIGFDAFKWQDGFGAGRWQDKIRLNANGQPASRIALNQLENCLKVANPWVFQVTGLDDILAIMEVAKQAYPGKKLVTECDDWLFDLPAYNVASNPYRPNSPTEKVAFAQFEASDAIITSTEFLKENLSPLFPSKPIYVIPNSIDFDLWDNCLSDEKMEKKPEGVVRIIYTGCGNHNGDLEIVKPVLLALLDEFPHLEVLIAQEYPCFKEVGHPRLKTVGRWVDIINYPSMLKGWEGDIGIAPLRDNAFNRAKSNLRWLEYSALKLPTVASNVRSFAESIHAGEDGFLCTSQRVWYETLKRLIENKELRTSVGAASYARVKNDFNMDKIAERYASILKEIRG